MNHQNNARRPIGRNEIILEANHSQNSNELDDDEEENNEADENDNEQNLSNNFFKLSNAVDYESSREEEGEEEVDEDDDESHHQRDDSLYDALSLAQNTTPVYENSPQVLYANQNTNIGLSTLKNNNSSNNNNNNSYYIYGQPEMMNAGFKSERLKPIQDLSEYSHSSQQRYGDLLINGDGQLVEPADLDDDDEDQGIEKSEKLSGGGVEGNGEVEDGGFRSIIRIGDSNRTSDLLNATMDELLLVTDNPNDLNTLEKPSSGFTNGAKSKIPTPIKQIRKTFYGIRTRYVNVLLNSFLFELHALFFKMVKMRITMRMFKAALHRNKPTSIAFENE